MKLVKNTLRLLSLSLLINIAGCDIVEQPYLKGPQGNGNQTGNFRQKVLLEKFTGHLCTNCPEAAQVAKNLKNIFGDRLVITSIHAGWFSRLFGETFSTNYRTAAGTQIHDFYGIDALPVGLINRMEFSGSRLLGKDNWGPSIAQALNQEPRAGLTLTITFNQTTRALELLVRTDILKSIGGQASLSAFICENGLVSPQIVLGQTVLDYVHDNVLRRHFGAGGAWGEILFENGTSAGQVFNNNFQMTLPASFNAQKCYIVAVLHTGAQKEVIQVEMANVVGK